MKFEDLDLGPEDEENESSEENSSDSDTSMDGSKGSGSNPMGD